MLDSELSSESDKEPQLSNVVMHNKTSQSAPTSNCCP